MKKTVLKIFLFFTVLSMIFCMPCVYAEQGDLIQDVQINLKTSENPMRLEVIFNLTETIDLSQGNSNIIYEYFSEDSSGGLEFMNYKKDKTWSGYLNTYENYPEGEIKYSSGTENNAAYSDHVPATEIYTSVKTSASIDVTNVEAVNITVLRADGSGEKVTVYKDGTVSDIELIVAPIIHEDKDTGIILESSTGELPAGTILVANKVESGAAYNTAKEVFENAKDFIVFNLTLQSDGVQISPDGTVRISIPIPEHFDTSNLSVYRIDEDGTTTNYPVTVTSNDGVDYATFETAHFSDYALVDESEKVQEEVPKTGDTLEVGYSIIIMAMSVMLFEVINKRSKVK
ncbi:MAG: hypothetical protein LBI03_01345 [Clostridiales bacterium]|nr:hypothetical protein [Clostridiales bacterium]